MTDVMIHRSQKMQHYPLALTAGPYLTVSDNIETKFGTLTGLSPIF